MCRCLISFFLPVLILGLKQQFVDDIRSILAQLEFTFEVRRWDMQGVPSRTQLYVPEEHPLTEVGFCEREDEGHVFKVTMLTIILYLNKIYCFNCLSLQRIGRSLSVGGPREVQLEWLVEAMHDPSTGLTYSALTGNRPQSVEDVELWGAICVKTIFFVHIYILCATTFANVSQQILNVANTVNTSLLTQEWSLICTWDITFTNVISHL